MAYKTTKIYYANHCLELTEDLAVDKSVAAVDINALKEQHLAATEGHLVFSADEQEQEDFVGTYSELFEYLETGGGVVEYDEQVLLIFRQGRWDVPKGKLESEEGLLQAAIREVEEETGVSGLEMVAPLPNTYHIYEHNGQWVFKTGYWFLLETEYDGALTPQTEEDITEVKWLPKMELNPDELDTWPGIRNLLRVYLDIYPPQ